jgi:hypothetical protein
LIITIDSLHFIIFDFFSYWHFDTLFFADITITPLLILRCQISLLSPLFISLLFITITPTPLLLHFAHTIFLRLPPLIRHYFHAAEPFQLSFSPVSSPLLRRHYAAAAFILRQLIFFATKSDDAFITPFSLISFLSLLLFSLPHY